MIPPENARAVALGPGMFVGEYQISHKLGEGGMGVVYAGTHPEIGKRVAIKVLAAHAAAHPDLIRRFKEEARAVNKIRHPNIIDIFAFNQLSDGRHYFVMEYLDGESLSARLARAPMGLGEARRLIGQICGALEAAHQAGVVHRDLKPDNIWVATEGTEETRIKLLDFGIAKLSDLTNGKTTQAGTQLGTPHYMPPEQGMGREIDRRADVYALGVVLYEMFAGALPFDGATGHEIVLKHVTEAPLPPSRHRPITPPSMEAIILSCLEKAPDRRPATAKELGARIEAAFAGEPATGTIPPLAAQRSPAAGSGGTEVLPRDSLKSPSPFRTSPLPSTTLGGSTGQFDTPASDDGPAAPARRSRRWPLALALGGAAALAVIYSRTGRLSVPVAATAPMPAAAPSPAAPSPAAPGASAARAVAAPPPPPEEPRPQAPATGVTVKIDSLPRGARVIDESDGALLGRTPFTARRARAEGAEGLRLELEGFKARPISVPLDASFEQTFKLEKRPRAAAPPGPSVHPAAAPAPVPAAPRPAQKKAAEIEWE